MLALGNLIILSSVQPVKVTANTSAMSKGFSVFQNSKPEEPEKSFTDVYFAKNRRFESLFVQYNNKLKKKEIFGDYHKPPLTVGWKCLTPTKWLKQAMYTTCE